MGKLDDEDIQLKKKIAERIAELREESGKRQAAFAYESGNDKQGQNRWEKGRGITIYSLNKFCKTIGITLSEFFDHPKFKG